jgi:HAE1 family hydrophobic/amphiphilic exporter-1
MRGLARWAVERPIAVTMTVIALITFGWVSYGKLPVRLLPDVSYPTLTIETEYPDAAPVEVETFITRPIEEAVGVIPGVRDLRSASRAGRSEVVLEFEWGTAMDETALDVREKLGLLDLPRESETPRVLRFDPNLDPVIRLAFAGDLPLPDLRRLAERWLAPRLEAIDGVAAAKVRGGLTPEIEVLVDDRKMAAYNVDLETIASALRAENINRPGGRIKDRGAVYLVRTLHEFDSLEQVQRAVVRSTPTGVIRIEDIAEVRRGHADAEEVARFDGREAIEIDLYREGSINTTAMAAAFRAALPEIVRTSPEGTQLTALSDQSRYIDAAVDEVKTAAWQGGLLAVAVLYFFLRDPSSTGVIALCIPVSIAITFIPLYQQGVSLNLMSLGGLALGVGNLVDNAIVVLEAIARYRREGMARLEAALRGATEMAGPVTASTMTTVAVFFPIVFVEGIAGQMFRDLALAVCWSQVISLLVGITLVPSLAARGDRSAHAARQKTLFLFDKTEGPRRDGLVHGWLSEIVSPLPPGAPRWLWPFAVLLRALAAIFGGVGLLLAMPFILLLTSDRGATPRAWVPERLLPMLLPVARRAPAEARPFDEFLYWALFPLRLVIFGVIGPLLMLIAVVGLVAWRVFAWLIDKLLWPVGWIYGWLEQRYPPLLERALSIRTAVVAIAALLFLTSLWVAQRLGTELLPEVTQGAFGLRFEFTEGTPLEVTSSRVAEAERQLRASGRYERVFSLAGVLPGSGGGEETIGENLAQIELVLPAGTRPKVELQDQAVARALAQRITAANVQAVRSELLGVSAPIEIEVLSRDLDQLAAVSNQLEAALRQVEGIVDVVSTTQAGQPEVRLLLDPERAAFYGLDADRVGRLMRAAIRGELAGKFREGDDRIDIRVRVAAGSRDRAEDVGQTLVRVGNETAVPVSALGETEVGRGPAVIHRTSEGRLARISAQVRGTDLGTTIERVKAMLATQSVPDDVLVRLAGQDEEMSVSFRSLRLMLLLALFLVFASMASLFESLRWPLLIMVTVPLGIVGVVLALWLSGASINVLVLIGVVILAGIVVNNAIVLIDALGRRLEEGQALHTALVESGRERLRPIVMTAATTVLGLVPMALSRDAGSELRIPLAVTVMGGLTVATLLTLVVIPCVFRIAEARRHESTGSRG